MSNYVQVRPDFASLGADHSRLIRGIQVGSSAMRTSCRRLGLVIETNDHTRTTGLLLALSVLQFPGRQWGVDEPDT